MTAVPRPSGAVLVSSRLTAIRGVLEEFGGAYWEVGQAKSALQRIEQIVNASRTASGIEAGGSASILRADVATVLDALDVAAKYNRDMTDECPDCDFDPESPLCAACESRMARADEYDALSAKLGGAS